MKSSKKNLKLDPKIFHNSGYFQHDAWDYIFFLLSHPNSVQAISQPAVFVLIGKAQRIQRVQSVSMAADRVDTCPAVRQVKPV